MQAAAALPFLVGIVPQNQVLQSTGVTWTRLELALGILPCVCVAISEFWANTDIWACSCSSFPSGLLRPEPLISTLWALQVLAKSQPPWAPSQKLLGAPHFLKSPALLQRNASSTSAASCSLPQGAWLGSPCGSLWGWQLAVMHSEQDAGAGIPTQPQAGAETPVDVSSCGVIESPKPFIWSFDHLMGPVWCHGFQMQFLVLAFSLGISLGHRFEVMGKGWQKVPWEDCASFSVLVGHHNKDRSVPRWIAHPFLPQEAKYSAAIKLWLSSVENIPEAIENWNTKSSLLWQLPSNSFWKFLLSYCSRL